MDLAMMKHKVSRLEGQKKEAENSRDRLKIQYEELYEKSDVLEEVQTAVQWAAKEIQSKLEFHISETVNPCLQSVFDEDLKLSVEFVERRGKTEADIKLLDPHSEVAVDPEDSAGHGVINIMSLALRMVMYSLARQQFDQDKKPAPVMVLDEPFKDINDPSRELHQKAAAMVSELSKRLELQIVIVTLLPELIETADKAFEVCKKGKVSVVAEN